MPSDALFDRPALHFSTGVHTPAVRQALLDASCGQPARAVRLIDAIEGGRLPATLLASRHWKRLAGLADAAVSKRTVALQTVNQPADRQEVISRYQAGLDSNGDVDRGRAVFAKNCAGCHRVGGVGVNVGSDISDSRTQKQEQYVIQILDPNRVIDSNYLAYAVVRSDGRVLTGLVVGEAGGALTLRQQDGNEVTLVRDEIETTSNTGTSLMPVGIERTVTIQDMADLIAFLKGWRNDRNGLPPAAAIVESRQK